MNIFLNYNPTSANLLSVSATPIGAVLDLEAVAYSLDSAKPDAVACIVSEGLVNEYDLMEDWAVSENTLCLIERAVNGGVQ